MESSSHWFVWALLSAVFAALTAIFAKIGLEGVGSDFATLIRTVMIVGVLAAFVHFTGQWSSPLRLSGRTWTFLALSALSTGASWLFYFRALKAGQASKVAAVDRMSLVLVALFAFFLLGERPTGRDWAGILMVAMGVLVLALKR